MDLTKSQNPNSMTLGSAKIEIAQKPVSIINESGKKGYQLVGLEDLGLARGISITPANTKIEVVADNGTVPMKGQTGKKITVAFSLLERHIPVLAKVMDGVVSVAYEAGELTTVTDKHLPGSVEKDSPIPLSKFNYNGNAPENVEVEQDSVLAENTDYRIIEYAGAYFIVLISDNFDSAKELKISYKVTPAKSYTMSQGGSGIARNLAMRLTNKRRADDGRMISRTWELPYGFCVSDDVITLKSNNDADNVAEVPLSFEFSPHPDMADNMDLEAMSLIREIQEV
ncbi:hypothetical protein [Breznakiella homolactica]|uniref:Uncharacterized protein n=1 Tax=Breznakiella homolactica TaxID=2798577 RepID=A0A7T7XPJ7_9SPIR|nr:hypothetical protein [Breznakiella homolactica]QQO10092.1 hypothetical protein JFL75_04015 [Breznakiella homolactica]